MTLSVSSTLSARLKVKNKETVEKKNQISFRSHENDGIIFSFTVSSNFLPFRLEDWNNYYRNRYIEMRMNTGGGANLIIGKKELKISC